MILLLNSAQRPSRRFYAKLSYSLEDRERRGLLDEAIMLRYKCAPDRKITLRSELRIPRASQASCKTFGVS